MPRDFLSEAQESVLAILMDSGLLSSFYLAGGAGLAFHLRHRKSLDLDFFTESELDTTSILSKLSKQCEVRILQEAAHTLTVEISGTVVSFFVHGFPLTRERLTFEPGVQVADILDIAAMKLAAIAGRGSKKDFVDLYFIIQSEIPLPQVFDALKQRYRGVEYDLYHILRSLTYFEDAESEQMPEMLKEADWDDIKSFFMKEAERLFIESMDS